MGRKIRTTPSRPGGGGHGRRRRRPTDPAHRKGLEPLSNVPLPVENEGSDLDAEELSDQDFEFVAEHSRKLSFLEKIEKDELDQQVLGKQKAEAKKRQQKIERAQNRALARKAPEEGTDSGEDLDELDQEHARTQAEKPGESPAPQRGNQERSQLPVKTPDGRIVDDPAMDTTAADLARRIEGVTVDDVFVEGQDAEMDDGPPGVVPEATPMDTRPEESPEDVDESQGAMMDRDGLKTQIALCANKMMTHAEKSVIPLRKLLVLGSNPDPQIQRLAMVSTMRVFKDIIPGYKIHSRAVTSAEQAKKKVGKEHLKLKEYESLLLRCYQAFLKILLNTAHAAQKTGSHATLRICIKCLCGLAESLHHFNYGTDLIKAVVSWMKLQDDVILQSCCHSIAEIIKTDSIGHRTLEAIQFVGDLVKRQKCRCHPTTIDALLHVTFSDLPTPSRDGSTRSRFAQLEALMVDKREKKTTKHRRRKMYKLRDALEKRGQDYEVHKPVRDKEMEAETKLQTETVEALFEIFFRVLKHCSHQVHSRSCYEHESSVHVYISQKCPLLAVALRGLAKYAHVMSVEYFEDLLKVMTTLLKCDALPFYERFQCLSTISSIFKGQGDALNIDRKDFYQQLYSALANWKPDALQISSGEKGRVSALLVQVCSQMLCETKSSDFGRLAAFMKRLLSVGLHQETGVLMGMCAIVNKLLVKYRRLRALMEGESEMPMKGSSYDPFIDDPSQAGGLLTSLWELTLLQKHFNPHTAQAARQLVKIKPDALDSEGGYMAAVLAASEGPAGVVAQYSTVQGTFCPPPSSNRRGSKRKRGLDRTTTAFQTLLDSESLPEDAVIAQEFQRRCLEQTSRRRHRLNGQRRR